MSYSYDRTAAERPSAGTERFERLVGEIRKKASEAKKMAVEGKKTAKNHTARQGWAENVKSFDRIFDELDGM